jgi:hypothetical protein
MQFSICYSGYKFRIHAATIYVKIDQMETDDDQTELELADLDARLFGRDISAQDNMSCYSVTKHT